MSVFTHMRLKLLDYIYPNTKETWGYGVMTTTGKTKTLLSVGRGKFKTEAYIQQYWKNFGIVHAIGVTIISIGRFGIEFGTRTWIGDKS